MEVVTPNFDLDFKPTLVSRFSIVDETQYRPDGGEVDQGPGRENPKDEGRVETCDASEVDTGGTRRGVSGETCRSLPRTRTRGTSHPGRVCRPTRRVQEVRRSDRTFVDTSKPSESTHHESLWVGARDSPLSVPGRSSSTSGVRELQQDTGPLSGESVRKDPFLG